MKTDPFKDYQIGQCLYGTPFYPNLEERNKLYHFDFSGNPRLEVQRDIFIFQSVIGCRVSDLKHLTKSSVIDGAIEYIPRKTKEGKPYIVRVPLNSIALEILEKCKDTPGDALLPCHKFDSHYNDDIKEMCFLAGKLSGHAEGSKAFARYRDIDEEMQRELVKMLE